MADGDLSIAASWDGSGAVEAGTVLVGNGAAAFEPGAAVVGDGDLFAVLPVTPALTVDAKASQVTTTRVSDGAPRALDTHHGSALRALVSDTGDDA